MHPARDHHLPPIPTPTATRPTPPGRIIVIAPTRAACETIELALGLHLDTLLEREHGEEIRDPGRIGERVRDRGRHRHRQDARASGPSRRRSCGEPLAVGVVNREREATPDDAHLERRHRHHRHRPALVPGRPHHRPRHRHRGRDPPDLGRAGALPGAGEARAAAASSGSAPRWIPPSTRATWKAPRCSRPRPSTPSSRRGCRCCRRSPTSSSTSATSATSSRRSAGWPCSCPTRAEVERLGAELGEQWKRLTTAFYHGGEPIRVIRPFLEGEVERPFLLAMTAAGQSALNVRGLDTVVIYDARYGNVVERGRNVLHRLYLGANEILQMAGRVHGRVPNGEVVILSDRDLVFEQLRPTPPEFQLAGDAERVAITCAAHRRGRAATSTCRCRSIAPPTAGRWSCSPAAAWWSTGGSRPTAARSRPCRWSAPGASCWCTPTPSWSRWWRSARTSTRSTA